MTLKPREPKRKPKQEVIQIVEEEDQQLKQKVETFKKEQIIEPKQKSVNVKSLYQLQ